MPEDKSAEELTAPAGGASEARDEFKPLSFVDALKQVVPKSLRGSGWGGGSGSGSGSAGRRGGAQPATGSEEDRVRVTFLDKRERLIGFVLGAFMATLGIASYISDLHYVDKGHPKVTAQVHGSATYILVVGLLLASLQIGATLSKRRALLGFALILSVGIGLNLFTIVYFGVGIWMVFRAMRKPRPSAAAAAGASTSSRASRASRASPAANGTGSAASDGAAAGRTTRARGGTTSSTPRPRPAPSASKRYTPPKPPAKTQRRGGGSGTSGASGGAGGGTRGAVEESGNRLTGWLKRRQAGVR